jgi:hypothetical protein
MLGAIHRVISGENMDEEGQQQQQQQSVDNNYPPNSGNMNDLATTFAIVENDDDNDNHAMDIENNNNNINEDDNTVGSSISDVSVAKRNDRNGHNVNELPQVVPDHHPMDVMDETISNPLPGPLPHNKTAVVSSIPKPNNIRNLSRTDSRNSTDSYGSSIGRQSSQNSSRDWGWFEETEHGNMTPHAVRRGPLTHREELHLLNQKQRQQQQQRATTTTHFSNHDTIMMMDEDAPSLKKGSKSTKRKGTGTSLLPYLALTASDDMLLDETQQILLDPPTDLESGKSNFVVTSCLVGMCAINSLLRTFFRMSPRNRRYGFVYPFFRLPAQTNRNAFFSFVCVHPFVFYCIFENTNTSQRATQTRS